MSAEENESDILKCCKNCVNKKHFTCKLMLTGVFQTVFKFKLSRRFFPFIPLPLMFSYLLLKSGSAVKKII